MDDNFETQGLNISNYRTHVSWWSRLCCLGPPVVGSIPASNLIFTGSVQGTKTWTFLVVNPVVLWLNPNLSSCWIPPGFIARVIPICRWSPPPLCWPSIRRCQPLQGLHHSTESREGSACKTSRIFLLNPIGWCMSSMIMTIMCVFIWLVEGWAIFHSIMIMCLYITYIYIFFIQIYIFSLWMLMGLFEGWSYSSAGMMGRKKHDTITIKRFFRIRFHFWMNST